MGENFTDFNILLNIIDFHLYWNGIILQFKSLFYEYKMHIDKFDSSNYSKNNRWNTPLVGKNVPELMKDELNHMILSHFIGLRSKQYTYKRDRDEDGRKMGEHY